MNLLWWILIGIGGVIGLVLLLLAGALFTKTAVRISYDGKEIKIRLRIFGISITVYPRKEKPTKEKPKKKKKTKELSPKKTEKKSLSHQLKEVTEDATFSDYVEILRTVLTEFVGKFRIEGLMLHVSVGGDDAMKIAMTYGSINALLYPILGAISAADRLDRCDVQITPDFTAEEFRAEGDATFSVRLIHGVTCLIKLIKIL